MQSMTRTCACAQEYQRCARILTKEDAQDGKSLFMRYYALYLAGERRKQLRTALALLAPVTGLCSLLAYASM